MAHDQRVRPRPPTITAADNVGPVRALDEDSWGDTFVIAGLVVALTVLVLLLAG